MKRIIADKVVKRFEQRGTRSTALEFVSGVFSKETVKKSVFAVDSISFSVKDGEKVGIIGPNGSGKSTLLRCIADIYRPTSGTITTEGSIAYVNGFSQGLNPKLTMRDNVFLIGSLRGVSRKIIAQQLNDIVEFSGLKDFVDMRVKDYSDGMRSRLNFSVAIFALKHLNPDILLLDEVNLSSGGGDISFQEKTEEVMKELMGKHVTVVLVSHKLESVVENCDRVLWIEEGRVQAEGDPLDVAGMYRDSVAVKRRNRQTSLRSNFGQ